VSANDVAKLTVDNPSSTRITGDKQHKEAKIAGKEDILRISRSAGVFFV